LKVGGDASAAPVCRRASYNHGDRAGAGSGVSMSAKFSASPSRRASCNNQTDRAASMSLKSRNSFSHWLGFETNASSNNARNSNTNTNSSGSRAGAGSPGPTAPTATLTSISAHLLDEQQQQLMEDLSNLHNNNTTNPNSNSNNSNMYSTPSSGFREHVRGSHQQQQRPSSAGLSPGWTPAVAPVMEQGASNSRVPFQLDYPQQQQQRPYTANAAVRASSAQQQQRQEAEERERLEQEEEQQRRRRHAAAKAAKQKHAAEVEQRLGRSQDNDFGLPKDLFTGVHGEVGSRIGLKFLRAMSANPSMYDGVRVTKKRASSAAAAAVGVGASRGRSAHR
jgi:hypothetical protein